MPVDDPTPLLRCAPNFRDIGGYATADGRAVRKGRVFRSQIVARPDEKDRATLRQINIRCICDLRGTAEREAAPNDWVEEPMPVLRHLEIGMDLRAGANELVAIIAADPTANGVRRMMIRNYSLLPQAFQGRLGALLDDILAGDKFPILVHCTAGKDRTGFVAALLLSALGVPMDIVRHDYELTERFSNMETMMAASAAYLKRFIGDAGEPNEAMLRMLCGANPDYLAAAFAAIEQEFGSTENYLDVAAGFDSTKRDRLRELMLE